MILEGFLLPALGILIAITVHEFAHAWMANRLGDDTPLRQGRLSLNPLVHLDIWGTLVLFVTGFRFGWGKPVQFNPLNLDNPKRDAAIISIAGPLSNMLVASVMSLFLKLYFLPFYPFSPAVDVIKSVIILNISLAVFNLVPIHPLDGGKILVGLLPYREAVQVDRFLHQYGTIILFFLILPILGGIAPISIILSPVWKFLIPLFIPQAGFI